MLSSRSDKPMEYFVLLGRRWRPIPGFENYFASDGGEILSMAKGRSNPKIMSQITAQDGHKYVFLYKDKKKTKMFVHRAVLMAWVGMPGQDEEGRHLNDKPWENNLDNLAWGTRQENTNDKRKNGGIPAGERSGTHKLTEGNVMAIRTRYANGESSRDIASDYGIAHTTVLQIVRGTKWAHLPLVPAIQKHSSARKTHISEEQIATGTAALKKNAAERKNPRKIVPCACGCGGMIETPDSKGRERKYIHGHNQQGRKWRWKSDKD